ncbi:unnamed protein product [Cuscuta europaea]|uniref:Uncharacterized protein n=1 Tax=Cuscuta europaea TaxID=41803 RepID=A0A9P1E1D8_CUSEU|nr:unnamed protein product [Cuscuta europaea]
MPPPPNFLPNSPLARPHHAINPLYNPSPHHSTLLRGELCPSTEIFLKHSINGVSVGVHEGLKDRELQQLHQKNEYHQIYRRFFQIAIQSDPFGGFASHILLYH